LKYLGVLRNLAFIALGVGFIGLYYQFSDDTGQGGGLQVTGDVTHVRDGDTIEVSGVPVRLQGLTCDERGTALGKSATQAVAALVKGQEVTCHLTGEKTYDREVGRCSLADGRDIGTVLISKKLCGRCDRYDPQKAYVKVQSEAGKFVGTFPGYCRA